MAAAPARTLVSRMEALKPGILAGPPLALACPILPPIKGAKHDPPRRHISRPCSPPLGRRASFRPRLSPRLAVHPSRGLAQSPSHMSAAPTFLGLTRQTHP